MLLILDASIGCEAVGVSHSRQYNIVSVLSCTSDEAVVFHPLDRFSNHLTHEFLLVVSRL